MKPMIQAHLVERDQFGFWTHPNYPDLADNCSSSEAQETLRRLGLELQNVFMESDAPRLYDSARSDQRYSEWIPTRPEGAGWFVLSIHDTDNGPVCQYVRPLGEHLSPIDLDAAAEQHERLLSEACAKALNQRDVALARVAELEMILRELNTSGLMQFSTADEEKAVRAALSGAQAQHSVPEWTSSKPAVEGAYWVRGNGLVEPFVVLVKLDQGELWCNLHMRNTDTNFGYGYAVDDLSSEFEWCGPLAAATGKSVPQAWLDVQAERRRQVEAENWTPEHDDQHSDGQMAQAAGCYALHAGGIGTDWPDGIRNGSALFWPWDEEWWKPKSARENLVRAGALVLAEIERLDRSATEQGSTCCKGGA
ncbi:hypothetical protein [Pseudomonas aeruginosa]|uniref:hypothetical protein n=1 Tax=Pseudomonas aeruginosa TaxID=287 RepID=UPI001F5B948E|nr:hypothetical protein [Pseudomonas aeruginosa]MDJ1398384.1 hypothetical protein [Pseudomonas aeruginosa]